MIQFKERKKREKKRELQFWGGHTGSLNRISRDFPLYVTCPGNAQFLVKRNLWKLYSCVVTGPFITSRSNSLLYKETRTYGIFRAVYGQPGPIHEGSRVSHVFLRLLLFTLVNFPANSNVKRKRENAPQVIYIVRNCIPRSSFIVAWINEWWRTRSRITFVQASLVRPSLEKAGER